MVSSTACLPSVLERLRLWLVLLVCLPALAWGGDVEVSRQQLAVGDDGYTLSADFRLELNPRLEEAVAKGLVLHFVIDFELNRSRWYWFDDRVAGRSLTYRLSFHPLTRQYRLSSGGLHQSFETLGDAVRVLSRLHNWTVVDAGDKSVRPGETYQAALRLRLDLTQLPRPFQIGALGNRDWNIDSDWKRWQVTLPPATTEVAR